MLGTLQREQLTWREKFDAGEVEPALKLLERHPEHDIKYAAIRGLIEGKSSRQAAQAFGHNVNTLQAHRDGQIRNSHRLTAAPHDMSVSTVYGLFDSTISAEEPQCQKSGQYRYR